MQDMNSYMFPDVYLDLGIDVGDMGCIMVDIEPLQIDDIIAEEDLYENPEWEHGHGYTSQEEPHVTLLYGLLNSGKAMQKHVDAVLDGWSLDEVEIGQVTYFEGAKDGDEYYVLVAEMVMTPALIEGNARLKLLPHVNTFPMSYKPHATLAYIQKDQVKRDDYIAQLNERFALQTVKTTGLNYGT